MNSQNLMASPWRDLITFSCIWSGFRRLRRTIHCSLLLSLFGRRMRDGVKRDIFTMRVVCHVVMKLSLLHSSYQQLFSTGNHTLCVFILHSMFKLQTQQYQLSVIIQISINSLFFHFGLHL